MVSFCKSTFLDACWLWLLCALGVPVLGMNDNMFFPCSTSYTNQTQDILQGSRDISGKELFQFLTSTWFVEGKDAINGRGLMPEEEFKELQETLKCLKPQLNTVSTS